MIKITRKEAIQKIIDLKGPKKITMKFLDRLCDDEILDRLDSLLIQKGRFFEKYKLDPIGGFI